MGESFARKRLSSVRKRKGFRSRAEVCKRMSASVKSMSAKKCLGGVSLPQRCAVARTAKVGRATGLKVRAAGAGGFVPDMPRRNIMNLLLVAAAGLPATTMLGAYAFFFVPQGGGGGGAGLTAKDALGNDVTEKGWLATHQIGDVVTEKGWLATHQIGDHSLTQGLKGDPTYLVVN